MVTNMCEYTKKSVFNHVQHQEFLIALNDVKDSNLLIITLFVDNDCIKRYSGNVKCRVSVC